MCEEVLLFLVPFRSQILPFSASHAVQKDRDTDFAKHVGPTVRSDRNLIGPIKPTFFSDQMSAIVRDQISVFTDVRSRFPRFSFEAWFPVKVKILIPRLNYFEGSFHGKRGWLVLLMGQSL